MYNDLRSGFQALSLLLLPSRFLSLLLGCSVISKSGFWARWWFAHRAQGQAQPAPKLCSGHCGADTWGLQRFRDICFRDVEPPGCSSCLPSESWKRPCLELLLFRHFMRWLQHCPLAEEDKDGCPPPLSPVPAILSCPTPWPGRPPKASAATELWKATHQGLSRYLPHGWKLSALFPYLKSKQGVLFSIVFLFQLDNQTVHSNRVRYRLMCFHYPD